MKQTYYWFRTCAACDGQGRLVLFWDATNGRLYLHCEECETGWVTPEDAVAGRNAFSTLDADFETRVPTRDEIDAHGWEHVRRHSFSD